VFALSTATVADLRDLQEEVGDGVMGVIILWYPAG
jgi:hypothetical protein